MPQDFVQLIIDLADVTRPVEQPTHHDWEALERDLQCAFPPDLKALISALGSGDFGAGFRLKNPNSRSEYAGLSRNSLLRFYEAVGFLESRMGIKLFPNPGGLVLIAGIDRQQFLLRPDQSGRASHLVHLDHDLEHVSDLTGSIPQLIYDLYHGRIDENWAVELRIAIWREGAVPFFTPDRGA